MTLLTDHFDGDAVELLEQIEEDVFELLETGSCTVEIGGKTFSLALSVTEIEIKD